MKQSHNMRTTESQWSRTRIIMAAIIATLAMFAVAPAISQAADGLSDVNSNNTQLNGKTLAYGNVGQDVLPQTKTLYLWSNSASQSGIGCSLFGSCSSRTITVNITLGNANYRRNGGTCTGTNPQQSVITANFTYSGQSGYRSCSIVLELKSGTPTGGQNSSLSYSGAASGSATLTANVSQLNGGVASLTGPGGASGSYDFGGVAIGDTATRVFTVNNPGSVDISSMAPALSSPQPSDWSISGGTCGSALPINSAPCTIEVTFAPTTEGDSAKTLSVTSSSHPAMNMNLTASGFDPEADIALSPMAYDYGGATSGFPAIKRYELSNQGNTTLSISVGVDPGPFSAAFSHLPGAGSCTATLGVGDSCTVAIGFDPLAAGDAHQTGSFTITGTTPLVPEPTVKTVNVQGDRVDAAASIVVQDTAGTTEASEYEFGEVTMGGNASYTFTVRNTGTVSIPSLAPSFSGPYASRFSVTGSTCGGVLDRDETCSVTVRYNATDGAEAHAVLTLTPAVGTATAQPRNVALTAQGTGLRILNNVNSNLTGANHKVWLDTLSVSGAQSGGDRIRVALEVEKGSADQIEDLLVSSSLTTNDSAPAAGTFNPVPGGIGKVEVQTQPGSPSALVIGEFPAASIFGTSAGTYGFDDEAGDIFGLPYTCGILGGGGTWRSDNRRTWLKLRTTNGTTSEAVGSIVRFTDGRRVCGGGPIIYDQEVTSVGGVTQPTGTLNAVAGVNEPVSFSFKGSSSGNFTGINWRIRNSRTGAIFLRQGSNWVSCGAPCNSDGSFSTGNGSRVDFGNTAPNTVQTLNLANGLPSRGRWIVEAAPRGSGQDLAFFMQIGSVLVNTASGSPTINLTGLPPARPDTDSDWVITAALGDPGDPANSFDSQGGRPQVIEWDLNNNTTDGADGEGFEFRHEGTSTGALDSAYLTKAFTTAGKTPGLYTIRVRVTDNGAIQSADKARRTTIATHTFTINSPAEAVTEAVDIEADAAQPAPVEFRADDVDGDAYTVDVTAQGGNDGSISGGGNTKDYIWPAAFTGSDRFDFIATDDKGGTGSQGTLTVRVRPNTSIDVAAPAGTNPVPGNHFLGATTDTTADFEFSSPQSPVVGYECRMLNDGDVVEDWTTCSNSSTGTYDYADLEDGLHRFEVRAINDEGQKDGTPAFKTWRVDNTVPVAKVRVGPPSDKPAFVPRPTNDPTPVYIFEADDRSPQEYVTYECRVLFGPDSGNWKPCGSPSDTLGSAPVQFAGTGTDFGVEEPLAEGDYSIEVRATDDVGLTGPATVEQFRVDLSPPTTSIASGPDGLINTRDVSFQVTSTEADSTFRCELVGQNQGVVFTSALCPGGSTPNFSGLADDIYELTITAIDPATNLDPTPPVAQFEIDATEPSTSGPDVDFGDGVTPDRLTQSRRITADFAGNDNRQMDGFQCRIDSALDEDWNICAPPETFSGLSDGEHVLEIRARDEAGNVDSSPLLIEWTVDTTPPNTSIDSAPADVTDDGDPTIEFSSSSDVVSSFCRVDEGSWTACASPQSVTGLTGEPLTEGPHTFAVYSVDAAGNEEATPALVSWVQDTVAPVVEITGKPGPYIQPQGAIEFGWTVKDGDPLTPAPEVDAECSVDGGTWEACERTLTLTDLANGAHTFAVRATDAAGNVSSEATHAWEIVGEPPVAPSIDNSDPAAGATTRLGTATFAFSHVDEGVGLFDRFECRLDDGPWQPCSSPHTVGGLSDGSHTFRLRVRDQVGNLSPVVDQTWQVSSAAPITTIESGPNGLTRQTGTTVTFSADKPSTFECRIDGETWASCTSPLVLEEVGEGQHSVVVRSVSMTAPVGVKDPTPPRRDWTVDSVAPGTSIESAPSGSVEEVDAQFTFSSEDPSATFQCKLDALPFDACVSPLDLNDLSYGSHTLIVRAIDAAGNVDGEPPTASWSIVAPPPEVCPPGKEGTPPNCTDIQPVEGDQLIAKLTGGELGLAALGSVELPAEQITLTGAIGDDGSWQVPQSGVVFQPVEQEVEAPGIGVVRVKIAIGATGPGIGTLTNGGGSASFSLPVQAKLEAYVGPAALIGPEADCYLRPIQFTLSGTWDASAMTATVGSSSVAFPTVSAGCGFLGETVNGLLELPRSDISMSLNLALERIAQACPEGQVGTPPDCSPPVAKPNLAKAKLVMKKRVTGGKKTNVKVKIRNRGPGAAKNVKVCLATPKSLVKGKAKRCRTIKSIAAGRTGTSSFTLRTKKVVKAKRATFTVTAPIGNGSRTSKVRGQISVLK